MYSHIVDSRFHAHLYSTDKSRQIFSDEARLQRWLDVEVAFAESQAEEHYIPQQSIPSIKKYGNLRRLDAKKIAQEIKYTGHSLVGLLNIFKSACPSNHSQYIHYGVTTQDIQDTGQSIEMLQVYDEVCRGLTQIVAILVKVAERHRSDIQVGRTHAQPACPITFGLKAATWIDQLERHRTRLEQWSSRAFVIQLFGASGTMSAMGPRAIQVMERTAGKLNLTVPDIGWHTSRDRIAEFITLLALLSGSLSSIADEIRTLSRVEIGEIKLLPEDRIVGSSTMPHKNNPDNCEQISTLGKLVRTFVQPALESLVQDHERDFRGTRTEWVTLTDASHYSLKSIELTVTVLETIFVDTEAMAKNALSQKNLLCLESITFRLAHLLGRETAMNLVREACQRAGRDECSIEAAIYSDTRVSGQYSRQEVARLFLEDFDVGCAEDLIDRVLRGSNGKNI